jgi:hypothetical protein
MNPIHAIICMKIETQCIEEREEEIETDET